MEESLETQQQNQQPDDKPRRENDKAEEFFDKLRRSHGYGPGRLALVREEYWRVRTGFRAMHQKRAAANVLEEAWAMCNYISSARASSQELLKKADGSHKNATECYERADRVFQEVIDVKDEVLSLKDEISNLQDEILELQDEALALLKQALKSEGDDKFENLKQSAQKKTETIQAKKELYQAKKDEAAKKNQLSEKKRKEALDLRASARQYEVAATQFEDVAEQTLRTFCRLAQLRSQLECILGERVHDHELKTLDCFTYKIMIEGMQDKGIADAQQLCEKALLVWLLEEKGINLEQQRNLLAPTPNNGNQLPFDEYQTA